MIKQCRVKSEHLEFLVLIITIMFQALLNMEVNECHEVIVNYKPAYPAQVYG